MSSPKPTWWRAFQGPEREKEAAYEPFRRLLESYLPMSQEELASVIEKDRSTISKWKSHDPSQPKATLSQQRSVIDAVRARLREIQRQTDKIEEMVEALETVEAAHQKHTEALDERTLTALSEANQRVQDLIEKGEG